MEDLFCEEILLTVLKGLKKDPGANSVGNKFFKHGIYEIRDEFMKILHKILKKGKYLVILG